MSTRANLKLLYERRDTLRAELAATRARLDEVEQMIKALGGEPSPSSEPTSEGTATRTRRGDLKSLVLALYEEAGEAGLSSAACVSAAKAKGVELQPASVSSLLSRLKADDVLFYDGDRYRLKRFAGPRSAPTREAV